jgi:phosphoribosylformylglycinamidine cyclo-ligase
LISGDVISEIINATVDFAANMANHGVNLHLAGGETADVGDIVRTIDVGYTAFARMKRKDLIINNIKSGDVIVGLASYGQSTYETEYNGGMGSNGLTSARHDVFSHEYAEKYPDSYDKNTPDEVVFIGSKKLTDKIEIDNKKIDIGKLILSPTRTFLPVLKTIFAQIGKKNIHGLIHCTGGGQAKVLKFMDKRKVVKDNLFVTPPLFELIQNESKTSWKEMYQVFNMGNRLEFYCDKTVADEIINVAKGFNIDAQIVGYVTSARSNSVVIKNDKGEFVYE